MSDFNLDEWKKFDPVGLTDINPLIAEIERLNAEVERRGREILRNHQPRYKGDRNGQARSAGTSRTTIRGADGFGPFPSDRIETTCSCGWVWRVWVTFDDFDQCEQAHASHIAAILNGQA